MWNPDSIMSHADFVHLRTHSAYSLCEGAVPAKNLVKLAAEHEMPALGLTDTDNLFGALEFSGAALDAGVQPIIGCQLSIKLQEDAQPGAKQQFEDGAVVPVSYTHLTLPTIYSV